MQVYLTFDIERNYDQRGYETPTSFSHIERNVPRILGEMSKLKIKGTFFVTPEVLANCENLIQLITRSGNVVGLHSHVYYQPEFAGSDRFQDYSQSLKLKMIWRDYVAFEQRFSRVPCFRIGQLLVDRDVLRFVSLLGCRVDSSFHNDDFHLIDKIVVQWLGLREYPVAFHLWGLTAKAFKKDSVMLVHPLCHPSQGSQVYDEEHLFNLLGELSGRVDFEPMV